MIDGISCQIKVGYKERKIVQRMTQTYVGLKQRNILIAILDNRG